MKFIALLATASALVAATAFAASPAQEKAFVDAYRGALRRRMPKRCMPCSTARALTRWRSTSTRCC